MMYNAIVKNYFFNPNHVGVIDLSLANTAHCRVGKIGQNTVFDWYLQCTPDGQVAKVCFKAVGTPYLIASLEYMCRHLQGQYIQEMAALTYQELVIELDIPKNQYPAAVQVESAYKELVELMRNQLVRK